MVNKGRARGGPVSLARHLLRTDHNERVTIREVSGVAAEDLKGALSEMHAMGVAVAQSRRTLYHAQINTAPGETLTKEQKRIAVDRLEEKLGLKGQPRVVVEHVKRRKEQEIGEEHWHAVWLRIDMERGIAIPDSHNFRKHEEVARELEKEFGHRHVQGAHAEREGKKRPARTPAHSEMQQAARSGTTPQEVKACITELWNRSDTGKAFVTALESDGWALARGDRRDFVIVDPAGETHSLAKRIDGARAAQVRERMADVDPASLPSVQEAKILQAERRQVQQPTPAVATAPRIEPEPVILKIESPPSYALAPRPLELLQNIPPSLLAEDRQPEIRVISEPIPESPPPPPRRDEIERRPAPAMFRQLYTAAAEITQRVLDRARQLFERPPTDLTKAVPALPPAIQPQPSPEPIRVPKPPFLADLKRDNPQKIENQCVEVLPTNVQAPAAPSPAPSVPKRRETYLERQQRLAAERGEPEINIQIERVRKLQLERPGRKPEDYQT